MKNCLVSVSMKNNINEVCSSDKNIIIKAILNTVLLVLVLQVTVVAEEKKTKPGVSIEVKTLSGISIIGNKESPKSLYIVPWQNSEIGLASSFDSDLLDDSMKPIDKEVFMRELNFYRLTHDGNP